MSIENELYDVVDKAKRYDNLVKIQGKFDVLSCSFCQKTQEEVRKLIAGTHVYICDECISLCNEILDEAFKQEEVQQQEDTNQKGE